jgi:hypothetical protein
MTPRAILLKKIDALLEEIERTRMFGSIEIQFRSGIATAIHTSKTDRLEAPGEYPRHDNKNRS